MGGKQSVNIIDLTNNLVNDFNNELKNDLDANVAVEQANNQKIDVDFPPYTKCKGISVGLENDQTTQIIQTADSETLQALTTILNANFDSTVAQTNQSGVDDVFDQLSRNQVDVNKTTIRNEVQNLVHNVISNSVKTFSGGSSLNNQTIIYDATLAKSLSCNLLSIMAKNKQDAQIAQLSTLILQNTVLSNFSAVFKNNLSQANVGFLGDFISSFSKNLNRILIALGFIIVFGIIGSTIGTVVYALKKKPSKMMMPSSTSSLLQKPILTPSI